MAIERAVILSAGRGTRLMPLTTHRPKCLVELSGRSLLEWQLDMLEAAGIVHATIVTGFGCEHVEEMVAQRRGGLTVETFFNPFYHVADNAGSVWLARQAISDEVLVLNGDTLVSDRIVRSVVARATAPISVTVDEKPHYDDDDMKVVQLGGIVLRIGKVLPGYEPNAESIGLIAFRGDGAATFLEAIERIMRMPDGVRSWYLKAIDHIAPSGTVGTISIVGEGWAEVDCPDDLPAARALTAAWLSGRPTAERPAVAPMVASSAA